MKDERDLTPKCEQCPMNEFEFIRIRPTRYMAVCHATESVLVPIFSEKNLSDCHLLSKANMETATFVPPDTCPYTNRLRNEGLLPWANGTIDFSKRGYLKNNI